MGSSSGCCVASVGGRPRDASGVTSVPGGRRRQVALVELVQVTVSSDTSGLELSHSGECRLDIIQCMLGALDVGSDMVWSTFDELRLVGQPVNVNSILALTVFLVLLHDDMCWTQPP